MIGLYITADAVGIETGGGKVTHHESEALKDMFAATVVLGRDQLKEFGLDPAAMDPISLDVSVAMNIDNIVAGTNDKPDKIAHFYAGCWTETIGELHRRGWKVTHTAAAHDIDVSREEHEALGIPFNYPHLTDPTLWNHYIGGYRDADVLICPSEYSADIMRRFGCQQSIAVVPHGVDLPEKVAPFPGVPTFGYLGSYGPDKGIRYLLQAWGELAPKNALLVLGGRDSLSPFVQNMLTHYKCSNVCLTGWVHRLEDFYSKISCYIQPSASEGFGMEIIEAMAHGRPVIASDGAGAGPDTVPQPLVFRARDVAAMKDKIDFMISQLASGSVGTFWRNLVIDLSWDQIRARYRGVWRKMTL